MRYTGVTANPGLVSGPLCIVHNAEEFNHCGHGAVALLVGVKPTAALVARVAGLAAVHGGVTSHAAIVARENGKPAVVGLPESLLKEVSYGMMATLDADHGVLDVAV